MARPFITVGICTWNRAALLDKTLHEMKRLRVPAGLEWEVLVVNNNCTDDTDEVIGRHTSSLPLRRLFEPEQGQSAARNCAIDAARGDLLLWTDDDVLVDADWLAEYARAAEQWPAASFFGGTIEPWFETEPPAWVRRHMGELGGIFAVKSSPPPDGTVIARSNCPFGANMAMRRSVFDSIRFDNRLSRKKDEQVRGEEILLLRHLIDSGLEGRWVRSARVQHYIPSDRLTTAFVWGVYHGHGIEEARLNPGLQQSRAFLGSPLWCHRFYWPALLQAWLLRPFKNGRWLSAFAWAARTKGYADEYRRVAQLRTSA